jgi:hypothetical protein
MDARSLFVPDGPSYHPTESAVGPWDPDLLQGSASAALLARALERVDSPYPARLARLAFDLWRPVSRRPVATRLSVLREGRKARSVEAALVQDEGVVARCTGLFLRLDPGVTPPGAAPLALPPGPDAGRAIPPHVKAWSPFFTGVDTRVIEGDLLRPGPATAWLTLTRALVEGEENSPLVQAVSAADLASGISAVVDLRSWTFVNADLTVTLWRSPVGSWILVRAETHVGDAGTGSTLGSLLDAQGPFGSCAQSLLFDRRPGAASGGGRPSPR